MKKFDVIFWAQNLGTKWVENEIGGLKMDGI